MSDASSMSVSSSGKKRQKENLFRLFVVIVSEASCCCDWLERKLERGNWSQEHGSEIWRFRHIHEWWRDTDQDATIECQNKFYAKSGASAKRINLISGKHLQATFAITPKISIITMFLSEIYANILTQSGLLSSCFANDRPLICPKFAPFGVKRMERTSPVRILSVKLCHHLFYHVFFICAKWITLILSAQMRGLCNYFREDVTL